MNRMIEMESQVSKPDLHPCAATPEPMRRGFLRAVAGLMTGGLGVAATVLGRAALGHTFDVRAPRWLRAARLDELETNVPTPVTLRIARRDGYLESVDQRVVFLLRSDTGAVRGLSSSCAHLGCSVSFNRERQQFLCPCHTGVFNLDGTVADGPPPRALDELVVKVERARVLVQA